MKKLPNDPAGKKDAMANHISPKLPHIFITGKAGHGKDSIGDHLIACYGYGKLSFSNGIRDEVSVAYKNAKIEVTPEWQERRDLKDFAQLPLALKNCSDADFVNVALLAFEKEDEALGLESSDLTNRIQLPRSPRRIQQLWGTEYRRSQDELYWLKYAEKNADFSQPQALTSVRYPNELEFGERINAVRFHVQRPNIDGAADHITERVLPITKETIVIDNDGELVDLYRKVDSIVAMLSIASDENVKKRQRVCP